MFKHKKLHLLYEIWADSNIVKTLSNFHCPKILAAGAGVLRRRRVDGKRERDKTEDDCSEQQKAYSETFHLIDKENGKDRKYDMGGL